jgi:hypothetical protein
VGKRVEAWEYGELVFLGVLQKDEHECITKYTARFGGREQIHGTAVEHLAVMDSFGRRGWRLKLVDELTAPAETDKQARTLASISDIEAFTGSPGTVISLARYTMARRIK